MNKFGAQALGRSFLSLLFAGDDNQQQLGRVNTLDLAAVFAVSRATWPQHLIACSGPGGHFLSDQDRFI